MDYRDSADISGGNVVTTGGGGRAGGGGRIAVGGIGGIIIMILALFLGFDPMQVLGSGTSPNTGAQPGSAMDQCKTGADIKANRECRWKAYMASIDTYWQGAFSKGYQPTQMVIFSGQVNTGCGAATSQVGPFYCPQDGKMYLDVDFTEQLLKQLGAKGGDAAEAYIVAHEFGHHIQNLTGIMNQVQSQGQQTGPASPQVRLELQADCYAGVWFRNSTNDPNGPIQKITQDDLNRVVDAAIAVGDDRIQESQTGRISPESWTHGSSAQRKYWMSVGFKSGNPNQCDTFSTNNLGG
jgi:predicted metalloprotease